MPTIYAKLSTAITIPFGPVLDSTGAEYTGLVVGEVKISKNNGTPAALNGSATLTHKEVGVYELVLTTSDISAVGQATLTCSKTTYVAPPVVLVVLPAKVYDSIVGGTDNLEVDVIQLLGTAWLTPGTAGTPDVNTKLINGVATTSITTINANVGTTQPVNFTGTGASALAKSDMVDVAGAAVSTSTAQIGVNVVNLGGTVQTGRDIGASVLLSSGTGTGQLKLASGYVAITWADIAAPTTTVNLSGTTVKTATDVEADTQDIQARLPAALVSGRIDASVGAMASNVMTATATDSTYVTELQLGLATAAAVTALGSPMQAGSTVVLTDASLTTAKLGAFVLAKTTNITGFNDISAANVNAEVVDVVGTDTLVAGVPITESLRRIGAMTSGIISGAGSGTETFKDYAESVNTIVISATTAGNRTAIVYN